MRKLIAILTAALLMLTVACPAEEMPTTPPDVALADVAEPEVTPEPSEPEATPEPAEAEAEPESSESEAAPEPAAPAEPSVLMPDRQQGTAMAVGGLFTAGAKVLGGDIPRETITEIRFESSLANVPAGAWDVSAEQNGSVMAWVQGGLLMVAGDGGVWANEDSSGLFAGYSTLTNIDFNDSFHTELAADLSHLFEGDWSLPSLDLSALDTSGATDMSYMFSACASLKELDASALHTENVANMEGMFLMDASLEALDLSGFKSGAVANMASMFEACTKLSSVDLSGFEFAGEINLKRMFNGCTSLAQLSVGAGIPTDCDTEDMFENCPARLSVRGVDMSAEDWANMGSYANLKRKSSGDGVRWLQTKLQEAGYEIDAVDGVFGAITEEALKAWQTDNGFEPTGATDADQVLALMKE